MSGIVDTRRRSVDVGGLRLATENQGHGNGWVGNQDELQTKYAELLGQLYRDTQHAVTQHVNPRITPPPSEAGRLYLITALNTWRFDPFSLNRDQVMTCTILLFEALFRIEGLQKTLGITLDQVVSTLHHLREIYRDQNAYHNFDHALDVLQASQAYLQAAGLVPPITILLTPPGTVWKPQRSPQQQGDAMSVLNMVDIFVIYIAAIGHDVGHPGFTNAFMKNAQAPLSVMFDDKSALENMHFQLLMQIMRHNGLSIVFDSRPPMKKLLQETILATDMRVHPDFMSRFHRAVNERPPPDELKLLLSQAIIKCADISNPSRPHYVSKSWAAALIKEWINQRHYEVKLDLPPSMTPSTSPLAVAQSQTFFMRGFAMPLLELMVSAVPECHPFLEECKLNFRIWEQIEADLQAQPDSESTTTTNAFNPADDASFLELSDDYHTAFPLTLPRVSPKSWSSDSSSLSEYSTPCSPSESLPSPFPLFPQENGYHRHRRPSSNGSSTSEGASINPTSPLVSPPSSGHSYHDSGCSFSSMRFDSKASTPTKLDNTLSCIRAAGQAASHAGLGLRKQKSMAKKLNRSSWSSPIPPSKNPFEHLNPIPRGSGGESGRQQQALSSLKFLVSTSDIPVHRRTDSDASVLHDAEEVRRVLGKHGGAGVSSSTTPTVLLAFDTSCDNTNC